MAADQDNSNGKVTLALIQKELERISQSLTKLDDLHDFCTTQKEFNSAVRCQLWDNGTSRIQAVEQRAAAAMSWVKAAIVPISLAALVGAAAWIWR